MENYLTYVKQYDRIIKVTRRYEETIRRVLLMKEITCTGYLLTREEAKSLEGRSDVTRCQGCKYGCWIKTTGEPIECELMEEKGRIEVSARQRLRANKEKYADKTKKNEQIILASAKKKKGQKNLFDKPSNAHINAWKKYKKEMKNQVS